MRLSGTALVIGMAVMVAATTAASAAPASKPGALQKVGPAVTAGAPDGYVVVTSPAMTAPTGVRTSGALACPGREVPVGGGVFVGSTSTAALVSGSAPVNRAWTAVVDNESGTDTTFVIHAVCVDKPPGYTVVTATVTSAPQDQQSVFDSCPGAKVAIGGGGTANATGLALASTFADASNSGWFVVVEARLPTQATFSVSAICADRPAGYFVTGNAVSNPAGLQTPAEVICPAPTVPLSGGAQTDSMSTAVTLNSSRPGGSSWQVWENNASAADATVTAWVVCAGT